METLETILPIEVFKPVALLMSDDFTVGLDSDSRKGARVDSSSANIRVSQWFLVGKGQPQPQKQPRSPAKSRATTTFSWIAIS